MIQLYSTDTVARRLDVEPNRVNRRVRGELRGDPLPAYKFGDGKQGTIRLPAESVRVLAREHGKDVGGLLEETHDRNAYSAIEAARVLDGTRQWVYKLIERGALRTLPGKPGSTSISRDDLAACIERHRVERGGVTSSAGEGAR